MTNPYLSYQDVFLIPEYSPFTSRSESGCSPEVKFGPRTFKVPVLPANMVCTIDSKLAHWMSENDYFYIMHRFNVDHNHPVNQDNMEFVKTANGQGWKTISISIGVHEEDREFLKWIVAHNYMVDFITIDIACGHSILMKEMIKFIRDLDFKSQGSLKRGWTSVALSYKPFVIAGNVATPDAVYDLEEWGADSVKVGIAQGNACTTYGQTGFGLSMFTCIQKCSAAARKPIIADGGIRMNGDFAKALVAGGTMVMAGSVFAACEDSPAETVIKQVRTDEVEPKTKFGIGGPYVSSEYTEKIVTKTFKRYYGSASSHNKGSNHHVEGRLIELPCNGMAYAKKLTEIEESLRSSISYAGGNLAHANWGILTK